MLLNVDPVLHPGDRLRIVCPDTPSLCVDRSIGPDGTVDLPEVGPLVAALSRPTQFAHEIVAHLDMDGRPARVEVRYLGSAPNEVAVEGAVEHALRVIAPRGISRERLLLAAVPTRDADLDLVAKTLRVRPGTELLVPSITAERRIEVVGSVATPKALPPANAMRLSSALESAGGLTTHGDPNGIVVVRRGESIPLALPDDAGFPLRPGDVVRVGTVADRQFVLVRGLVPRPGSVEYARGMTALRAIESAGGFASNAREGTLIWRTGPKVFRLSIAFLLSRRIPDPLLSPADTLDVEARRA